MADPDAWDGVPPPEDPLHPTEIRPAPAPPPQAPAVPTRQEYIQKSLQDLFGSGLGKRLPDGRVWFPKEYVHDYLKTRGEEYAKFYNPEALAKAEYLKAQSDDLKKPDEPAPMNALEQSTANMQNALAKQKNYDLEQMIKNGQAPPPPKAPPPPSEPPEPVDPADDLERFTKLTQHYVDALSPAGLDKLPLEEQRAERNKILTEAQGYAARDMNKLKQKRAAMTATATPATTVAAPAVPPVKVPDVTTAPSPAGGSSFLEWRKRMGK